MRPLYKSIQDDFEIYKRKSSHFSPHLHNMIEIIYVTEGSIELGIMQNLYHMEEGDLCLIFPGMIHHSQVFETERTCTNIDLLASTSFCGNFLETLRTTMPEYPVLHAADIHPDVKHAIFSLLRDAEGADADDNIPVHEEGMLDRSSNIDKVIIQAFLQIILARTLPRYHLIPRQTPENEDLIYRSVEYIAAHFTEPVSLTGMARQLYVSPYALSRMFSGTFHTNFNGYLNDTRLEYVCSLLRYTDQSITDAYMNAGFESQRTFNRVFQDKMHMSPRDYRNSFRAHKRDTSD